MRKSELKTHLAGFFQLSEHNSSFNLALCPKSCGGDDEFKYLALYGDAILNLLLLDLISRNALKDSGQITEILQTFHNEETLFQLSKELKINEIMQTHDEKAIITKNDLKESIEALLGATYINEGLNPCKDVIKNLVQLAASKNLFNSNPKGILQVFFQKKNLPIPKYESKRVGGPDHQQVFQTTITGEYLGKSYMIQSDILPSKKDAEKNAAEKFLIKLGQEKLLKTSFF
jgi:ribonuclease-3